MGEQLREALEKAFDATSGASDAGEDIVSSSSDSTSAAGESSPSAAAPVAAAPVSDAPKAVPAKAKSPGQAAKEAREAAAPIKASVPIAVAAKAPDAAAPLDAQGQPAAPATPKTRAPGSWSPALREKWGNLPDEVRDHITKREAEITSQLTQSASARKLADEFVRTINPYQQLIRTSGVSPTQAVGSLLNTAATLQMGTPQQKVEAAAKIIKSYGIDLAMLDQALVGTLKQDTGPEAMIEKILQQRLAPVNQLVQRLQQSEQQGVRALADEARGEYETFRQSPNAEFLEDVADEMADLLELAARRGREMSIDQAYEAACNQNPEIRAIRDQRAEVQRIGSGGSPASRARIAAASLPAGAPPAGGAAPNAGTRREALNAAWDNLSSR